MAAAATFEVTILAGFREGMPATTTFFNKAKTIKKSFILIRNKNKTIQTPSVVSEMLDNLRFFVIYYVHQII